MERPNPAIKIYILGYDHGLLGYANLPLVQQEAQRRFIPKNEDGLTPGHNLFVQELFDGTEAFSTAYKALTPEQSILEAYHGANSSYPRHIVTRIAARIRSTSADERTFLDNELLMIDELRRSVDLVADCEHYSPQQGAEYRRVAESTHRLIEQAISSLIRGKFKDMNRLYAESLLTEAKPFHLRNRTIAKLVREDTEDLSVDQLPVVVITQIGHGHVKDLVKEVKDGFAKTGQKPVVEGLLHLV